MLYLANTLATFKKKISNFRRYSPLKNLIKREYLFVLLSIER